MNPTCTGVATGIYGTRESAFVPKAQVNSTGCFDASVFFLPYNVNATTGVEFPYARFYSSYSVGGNKYGQIPVSAQIITSSTKGSSVPTNPASDARSFDSSQSVLAAFTAILMLLF